MPEPTVLAVPPDSCRIILEPGAVVLVVDGQLLTLGDWAWFEMEPRLESTVGNWRRALHPFNRKFLFWVKYAEHATEGVAPVATSLYPFR